MQGVEREALTPGTLSNLRAYLVESAASSGLYPGAGHELSAAEADHLADVGADALDSLNAGAQDNGAAPEAKADTSEPEEPPLGEAVAGKCLNESLSGRGCCCGAAISCYVRAGFK